MDPELPNSFTVNDTGFQHWLIQPPVLGGGQLGAGSQPRVGTPKTENSTELTHYFLGWTQIHFRKKFFFLAFGGHKTWCPPSWALGGMAGSPPPPPVDPPVGFKQISWVFTLKFMQF